MEVYEFSWNPSFGPVPSDFHANAIVTGNRIDIEAHGEHIKKIILSELDRAMANGGLTAEVYLRTKINTEKSSINTYSDSGNLGPVTWRSYFVKEL